MKYFDRLLSANFYGAEKQSVPPAYMFLSHDMLQHINRGCNCGLNIPSMYNFVN